MIAALIAGYFGVTSVVLYLYHRFGLKPVLSRLESTASRLETDAETVAKAARPMISVGEAALEAKVEKLVSHLEGYATKSEWMIRHDAELLVKEIRGL